MTKSTNNISADISMNGQRSKEVTSFASKFELYKSLVTSILLSGCETSGCETRLWKKKRSRPSKLAVCGNFSASATWSTRPTTRYEARSTLLWVHRNLFWQLSRDGSLHGWGMSHTTTGLSKNILQGTVEGGRRRGQQRKCRMDNIKEWTFLPVPELLTRASRRNEWKRISAKSSKSSLMFPR